MGDFEPQGLIMFEHEGTLFMFYLDALSTWQVELVSEVVWGNCLRVHESCRGGTTECHELSLQVSEKWLTL